MSSPVPASEWPDSEEKFYAYEAAPGVWQVIERLAPRDDLGSCQVKCFTDCGSMDHAELFAKFIAKKANDLFRGWPLDDVLSQGDI